MCLTEIIYQVKIHSHLYDITFYLRTEYTQTKACIANLRVTESNYSHWELLR